MSSPASKKTVQISVWVPYEWLARADSLAAAMSQPGHQMTRADVFRVALAEGLEQVEQEASERGLSR